MSVLVVGASGQVGTALTRLGATPAGREPEIGDARIVINCAAWTGVDAAEADEAGAFVANAALPARLVEQCNQRGARLIHLSTDYVFDGALDRPYREHDAPAPIGAYGRSKLAGEAAIRAAGGPHWIVRTAWLVSPWRQNFVRTMIRLAAERDELRIVDDQFGSPTSALDLADALLALAARPAPAAPDILNLVNAGEASWFDVAGRVMDRVAASGRKAPRLVAIPASAYPTPAARPANSRLDGDKARALGIVTRPWAEAIDAVADAVLKGDQ